MRVGVGPFFRFVYSLEEAFFTARRAFLHKVPYSLKEAFLQRVALFLQPRRGFFYSLEEAYLPLSRLISPDS